MCRPVNRPGLATFQRTDGGEADQGREGEPDGLRQVQGERRDRARNGCSRVIFPQNVQLRLTEMTMQDVFFRYFPHAIHFI